MKGIQIYLMKKRHYTTERAVSQLSKSLRIPRKFISYAGTKDKNAVTYQYISIKGVSKEKISALDLKDIQLEFCGFSKEALRLGTLEGNNFQIILRDLPHDFSLIYPEEFKVPNYFDEQRFSSNNLDIGLNLLKQNFKEALNLIIETDQDFGSEIKKYLENHKNDFVGALRLLPKKTILFYIHSVQSYIFNKMLASKIEGVDYPYSEGNFKFSQEYPDMDELPLIGYLIKDFDDFILSEGLTHQNFLIRSLPDFSLEGSFRNAFFKVKNFKSSVENDDVFEGRKKCNISFDLSSGSYATIVLKNILARKELKLEEIQRV